MSSIIFRTIRDRRSVRKYLPMDVSSSALQRILDATRWAPSAHNSQPWRFIVVNDLNSKQMLVEAMAQKWNEDLRKDGTLPKERKSITSASVKRFTDPPTIVIACLTMEHMDKYPDEKRRKVEYVMAVQSVAAAIQNMLLVAHAEGLGACWFCAPLFCPEAVRKILGIPENVHPQALITLGYPDERPKAPPRKPLESIVYQNRWGTIR